MFKHVVFAFTIAEIEYHMIDFILLFKVRSLLFPYFMDQEEVEEVRIGSYLVMTGTNPSRAFLEMLAQSLYRENNPHVGTFVYTHLEQISNSTHPCLMSW